MECLESPIVDELPWLEFELPAPPSVNLFMGKLGNKTPAVTRWSRQADLAFVMAQERKLYREISHQCTEVKHCRIIGKFEAEFLFGRDRSDFHNREKALFDWLQSREFVENDKLCEWRGSGWSDDVPTGRVVVRIRPFLENKK